MNRKPFSKSLYDECDNKGKQMSIKLMQSFGYTLKDDSEAFCDRDIIMTKDGKDVWVEAEISPAWKYDYWPSSWNMTCPTRKKRSKAHLYIRANADLTCACVVPMQDVLCSPTLIKDTKYTKNEEFFNIPIDKCDFFNLSDVHKTNSRYF